MIATLIHLKQTVIENKDLLIKTGVTLFASTISQIEKIDGIIRLGSSIIALLVGILTLIKLYRDIVSKNKKKKDNE